MPVAGLALLLAATAFAAAPIASLAKVLTAYLTLQSYPLSGAQGGFTITVTAAQAQAQDAAQDQSVAAVRAGEAMGRGEGSDTSALLAGEVIKHQHPGSAVMD